MAFIGPGCSGSFIGLWPAQWDAGPGPIKVTGDE